MTPFLIVPILFSTQVQTLALRNFVPNELEDISLTVTITKGDQTELRKINKDFGATYRFKQTTLSFRVPFMMRAEAKVEDSTVSYVINGTDMVINMAGFKSKQNLANHPGRRQSPFEIGLVTKDVESELFEGKYLADVSTSTSPVFDLNFRQSDIDKTRNRVWFDAAKKILTKREWYDQEGKLKATFLYSAPTQVAGQWVPTHMEVRNSEGNLAGISDYSNIKVNSGLAPSLFVVK